MLARVLRHMEKFELIPQKGGRLICAVSGGVDSMVLLHLMDRAGFDPIVATVEHGLRGEESKKDMRLVEEYARSKNLEFLSRSLTLLDAARNGRSMQMMARDHRYEWFHELLESIPGSRLATAHHKDDQLETLLLGILQGVGVTGVGGIPVAKNRMIRPLLCVTRQEIHDYAIAEKIPFREDKSNQDPKYLRSRIRHELIPLMEDMAGSRRTLYRFADLQAALSKIGSHTIIPGCAEHDVVWWPRAKFNSTDAYLLVGATMRPYGLHPEEVDGVVNALSTGSFGKSFSMGELELLLERDRIVVRPSKRSPMEPMVIDDIAQCNVPKLTSELLSPQHVEIFNDPRKAFFDAGKVSGRHVLRPWQAGDRMRPYGMKGTKLISDMLNELDLDVTEKEQALVLDNGKEVLWLVGHRIADGYGVQRSTESVLCIHYHGNALGQESKWSANPLETRGSSERTFIDE